jgi:hypothetical protein
MISIVDSGNTDRLRAKLASSYTTNRWDSTVGYVDVPSNGTAVFSIPAGKQQTTIVDNNYTDICTNGGTGVTRQVRQIALRNRDTISNTVTV